MAVYYLESVKFWEYSRCHEHVGPKTLMKQPPIQSTAVPSWFAMRKANDSNQLFLAVKAELCSFSGYKIYPGHGRCYIRNDGKGFQFLNAKCKSAFLSKRNPGQLDWTVLYRRKHKKGQSEELQKKRTRRAVKFQRAITGASPTDITAKRNQKPEVRKAQQEQAFRAVKEAKKKKKKVKQTSEKAAMAAAKAPTKAAPKQKMVEPVEVSAPCVAGKR
ncbi:large ribosomal subunit protein eL24-like [Myotis yumanensis]|uniref:large ribosomal subunit protein eL24-like n=1 Tax=Myotis yumanensis TaxID=159337 RepID=UPI0038D0B7F4